MTSPPHRTAVPVHRRVAMFPPFDEHPLRDFGGLDPALGVAPVFAVVPPLVPLAVDARSRRTGASSGGVTPEQGAEVGRVKLLSDLKADRFG